MKKNKSSKFLIISSFTAIVLILIRWFSNEIVDAFFIFAVFMFIDLFILFTVLFIFVLIAVVKYKRKNDVIALIILIAVCIIYLFFPFDKVKFNLEFQLKLNRRYEVVNYVKKHDVTVSDTGTWPLSLKDRDLSSGGGDIIVDKNKKGNVIVGFFIFRGFIDGGSDILVYCDGNIDDIKKSISYIYSITKIKDTWYYVITE